MYHTMYLATASCAFKCVSNEIHRSQLKGNRKAKRLALCASLVAPQSECHANQSHLAMSRVTSREVRVFSKDTQGEGPFTKPSSLLNANFDLFE